MSHTRQDPCTAEIIIVEGESFVVDERLDIIAAKSKSSAGAWIADWGGCPGIKPISLSASTRQEAIDQMADQIHRKKSLMDLRTYFERKKAAESITPLKHSPAPSKHHWYEARISELRHRVAELESEVAYLKWKKTRKAVSNDRQLSLF